ncbi:MAG TPA: endolytic transglycosylase MltG [Xanthobacteraceae bacterium]|jgi:UPF0755 protein
MDAAPESEERPIIHPKSPRQALMAEMLPPPPYSRRARHPIVVIGNAILTAIVLLIIAGGAGFYFGKQRYETPGPLDRERTVVIPRGGIRDTADLLRREGVIDQAALFVGAATLLRVEIKAGEYLFERNASMRDVLDTLVQGQAIQHQVTIAEGLTSEQIVQKLMESEVLTGALREIPREGTLLPETYKVTRGTTREQVVARMANAQKRILQEVWDRRAPDLPVKSAEELVVLASIVEKETGKADERSRVAGVFVNRLNRRMRLESDPTIVYGLVAGKGTLGRGILQSEKAQATPYNTYVIYGLPPGPIANPGRASLEAAANPSRTRDYYFVADGTGGHVFAETYDQHLKNVARWREVERERRDTAPVSTGAPVPTASEFAPTPTLSPNAPGRTKQGQRPPPRTQ